jgi:hypothetical protein
MRVSSELSCSCKCYSFRVIKQVITEQLLKMKETFSDLSTLETAEMTAADRLQVVRLSMRARVSLKGGES